MNNLEFVHIDDMKQQEDAFDSSLHIGWNTSSSYLALILY
jgi:hypothetical protein